MTECGRLSDRIPEVALGHSRWNPEEAAHLARCPDCRAEWELVLAVHGVAGRAPVPRDPTGVAAAVLRRLGDDRRSQVRTRRGWAAGVAAAAAVALLVWAGVERVGTVPPDRPPPLAAAIALPELEPLETAELDSLLDVLDAGPVGWSALVEPTLGDLDAEELERVLGTWEG